MTSPWLFRRYQRVRPSYAALTAAGQLSLIDDPELRAAIVGYFDREQEDFMQARADWLNVRERLIAEWNEYMGPTASEAFVGYYSTPDELGGQVDWEGLRRDDAGAMISLRFSALSEVQIMRGEATLAANARLAAMLDP